MKAFVLVFGLIALALKSSGAWALSCAISYDIPGLKKPNEAMQQLDAKLRQQIEAQMRQRFDDQTREQ